MGTQVAIRLNGAPDTLVASASGIEVDERVGQPTQYRLKYGLALMDGNFPLLKDVRLGPGSELSILVPTTTSTHCLVSGPVIGQEIHFVQGGSGSSLIVLGADSLIKMDREDKAVAWSDITDSDAVSSILAQSGFVSDVESTAAGHFELKHTLVQRETDLAFIRRLARRNGSLFWLSCDEFGVETAHFKRPVLTGTPACDLVVNRTNPTTNVIPLKICWDVERPAQAQAAELDLNNKTEISGGVQRSPLKALGGTALADIVPATRIAHVQAPVDDSGDLQARSESTLIESSFFLRATGVTTLSSLKAVLRSHTLVNLRGVGPRHNGLWFCSAVRHVIDSTEHLMKFELIRNGWTD